jgi:hypothetical protein
MGWESVEYKCGHTAKIQMHGKIADRERKVEQYRGMLCPECYAAEQAPKIQTIAVQSADIGLPALIGSPKQIAWAETIRAKQVADIDKSFERLATIKAAPNSPQAKAIKAVADDLGAVRMRSKAEEWINGRHYDYAVRNLNDRLMTAYNKIVKDAQNA